MPRKHHQSHDTLRACPRCGRERFVNRSRIKDENLCIDCYHLAKADCPVCGRTFFLNGMAFHLKACRKR